jgi:hypothetical protein
MSVNKNISVNKELVYNFWVDEDGLICNPKKNGDERQNVLSLLEDSDIFDEFKIDININQDYCINDKKEMVIPIKIKTGYCLKNKDVLENIILLRNDRPTSDEICCRKLEEITGDDFLTTYNYNIIIKFKKFDTDNFKNESIYFAKLIINVSDIEDKIK